MPIYEFKCKDCGKEFEVKLPMSRAGEKQSSVSVVGSTPVCPTGTCGLQ